MVKCKECDGRGTYEWHNQDFKCSHCEGTGIDGVVLAEAWNALAYLPDSTDLSMLMEGVSDDAQELATQLLYNKGVVKYG